MSSRTDRSLGTLAERLRRTVGDVTDDLRQPIAHGRHVDVFDGDAWRPGLQTAWIKDTDGQWWAEVVWCPATVDGPALYRIAARDVRLPGRTRAGR